MKSLLSLIVIAAVLTSIAAFVPVRNQVFGVPTDKAQEFFQTQLRNRTAGPEGILTIAREIPYGVANSTRRVSLLVVEHSDLGHGANATVENIGETTVQLVVKSIRGGTIDCVIHAFTEDPEEPEGPEDSEATN